MKPTRPRLHPTYAALLRARAILAGGMVPEAADAHVMAMLFMKTISDKWLDSEAGYKKSPHISPRMLQELMANERYIIPAEAHFDTLHRHRHDPGCGGRIDQAIRAVVDANLGKLRGMFQHISFEHNMVSHGWDVQDQEWQAQLLAQLLETFAGPALNFQADGKPQDGAAAGDFLLRHFAAMRGKSATQPATAPAVATLLARLAAPREGDEICDPACGAGALLLACATQLPRGRFGYGRYSLFGQEADDATWAAARLRLLLHGEDNHLLACGDLLRAPGLLTPGGKLRKFAVQVCALPMSCANWGQDAVTRDSFQRFRRGLPPAGRADLAYLCHMAACMKPETGRIAALCAPGLLSLAGPEGKIRRRFLEDNLVDAVINLPPNLLPGLDHGAAILLLRVGKVDDSVLFVDAESIPRGVGVEAAIGRIVDVVAAREGRDGFAHLAAMEEIEAHDFDLGVARYVDARQPPQLPSSAEPAPGGRELGAGDEELARQLEPHLAYLGLADLILAGSPDEVAEQA